MDHNEPSIALVWEAFTGYQRTAAIRAAIELDVFTHISGGATTIEALATKCKASARGLRALLNHLVMDGFLTRKGEHYGLTLTAEAMLVSNSPSYLGSAITFMASPMIRGSFDLLTEAVRRGGTAVSEEGTLSADHPVWISFARSMAPLAGGVGAMLANYLDIEHSPARKVLDIAASHGMFGIALARFNPALHVTALDWKNVLAVAEENARAAGVADRFHLLPGSAFEVPFGNDFDLVLLPNFLHHFDKPTCEKVLAKVHAALAPGGRAVIVEFVPDDDRSGPADAVRFALVMLATTPSGDAYTFAEYQSMLRNAGFSASALHELPPSPARVVIAQR